MTEEIDPEVLADLQLRISSERDSTRSRGSGTYAWTTPVIVAHWRCRSRESCRTAVAGEPALVGVTQETLDALEGFNSELRRRMQADLPTHSIVFCDECKRHGISMQAEANRKRADRMAERVRKLRDGCSADEEREIIEVLRKTHPDVDGLLRAIRERREGAHGGKPKRSL